MVTVIPTQAQWKMISIRCTVIGIQSSQANNGPYERTSFGAYVLFPWFDEDTYLEHHFYKSINEVNIGALPFLPNATSLVEQFVERLIDSSPEELQEEGILPIGSKEQWISDLDEKVFVGLVSSKEDYTAFIQEWLLSDSCSFLEKRDGRMLSILLCMRKVG